MESASVCVFRMLFKNHILNDKKMIIGSLLHNEFFFKKKSLSWFKGGVWKYSPFPALISCVILLNPD